jgi:tetratricopeptide (TPR) repeat protein
MSTRFCKFLFLLCCCLILVSCEDSDVRLGREALEGGDPDKALKFFALAVERNPGDTNVRTLIARANARNGNISEANRWLRDAQRLGLSGSDAAQVAADEARTALKTDVQRALSLYALAVGYNPSLAGPAASAIINKADEIVATSPLPARVLYEAALNYDRTLSSAAAKKISEAAIAMIDGNTNVDTGIILYRDAVKYDPTLSAAAGEKIYQIATKRIATDTGPALVLLQLAIGYNPTLKDGAGDLLYGKALESLASDNFPRTADLAKRAVSYNSALSPKLASAVLNRANQLGPDPGGWEKITWLAAFARTLEGTDNAAWGDLLYGLVTGKAAAPQYSKELVSMGNVIIQFDRSRNVPLAKFFLNLGTMALIQDTPNLNAANELYNGAIDFDPTVKSSVSSSLWAQFSSHLFAPTHKLGKDAFRQFFQMANNSGVPAEYANTVLPYARALNLYLDGNRTQAIGEFKQIEQSRPGGKEAQAAKSILSPPAAGTVKFNVPPMHFGTWSYGAGGGRGVEIQLLSAEVTSNDIGVTFSVKSSDHPDLLLFSRRNFEGGFIGSHCELLYILDDNGTKMYSSSGGFTGGRQTNFNDCAQAINLNAGEEAIVTARFPLISAGATTIKFVSPDPDKAGHQSEWWVQGLELKKGPFDDASIEQRVDPAARKAVAAPSMAECSVKYKTAKDAGTLNGMNWNDFRKAQCAGVAPPPISPPAASGSIIFPSAVDPKYSGDSAGKARMETCQDQYNANRATNGNGGLNWIQEGGGYYSECNKHMKTLATAKACSDQADARNLHGNERSQFRSQCISENETGQ